MLFEPSFVAWCTEGRADLACEREDAERPRNDQCSLEHKEWQIR